MSFATQTFTGPVSGSQGSLSTSGTFTATLTGHADGSVSGTWSFSGTYSDPRYGAGGAKTLSGALASTASSQQGPWTLDLGAEADNETVVLSYADGRYSLNLSMGYFHDIVVTTGYDVEYTYHDFFQFSAAFSAAGAAPTGVATAGNDTLAGGAGNDILSGLAGNDTLDGAGGMDTAVFAGARASYSVVHDGAGQTVTDLAGTDGTDTLANMERLQFSDRSVNLTVGATAHTITEAQLDSLIELYIAYLNRVPDADGMAFWVGRLAAGQTLDQIGEAFYGAAVLFGDITGYSATMSNQDFVTGIYNNVLGRPEPDAEGLAFWSNELATGHSTRGTLVAAMLGSAHSFKGREDFGWVADLLDNKIAVGKTFAVDQGLVYNTSQESISHGMAIAAAVTPTSTAAAIALIGVNDGFDLY